MIGYGRILNNSQIVLIDGVPSGFVWPVRMGRWRASTSTGPDSGLDFRTRQRAAQWVERSATAVEHE